MFISYLTKRDTFKLRVLDIPEFHYHSIVKSLGKFVLCLIRIILRTIPTKLQINVDIYRQTFVNSNVTNTSW